MTLLGAFWRDTETPTVISRPVVTRTPSPPEPEAASGLATRLPRGYRPPARPSPASPARCPLHRPSNESCSCCHPGCGLRLVRRFPTPPTCRADAPECWSNSPVPAAAGCAVSDAYCLSARSLSVPTRPCLASGQTARTPGATAPSAGAGPATARPCGPARARPPRTRGGGGSSHAATPRLAGKKR